VLSGALTLLLLPIAALAVLIRTPRRSRFPRAMRPIEAQQLDG